MKRKKLLSIGKLKAKADRAMQDYFRATIEKCEICGGPNQVSHHFIWKSQSNYLRYEEKNLVHICNPCHSKFHAFPDPLYPILVSKIRGMAWVKWIQEHKRMIKSDNRTELESIISRYSLASPRE